MAKRSGEAIGVQPENIDLGIQNAGHAKDFFKNVKERFGRVKDLAGNLNVKVRDLERLIFNFELSSKQETWESTESFRKQLKKIKENFKEVLSRLEEVESRAAKTLPAVVEKEAKTADEIASDEWHDMMGTTKAVFASNKETVRPSDTAVVPVVKEKEASRDVGPTGTQAIKLDTLKQPDFERLVKSATEIGELKYLYEHYKLKNRSKKLNSRDLKIIKKALESLESIFSKKIKGKVDREKLRNTQANLLSVVAIISGAEKARGEAPFEPVKLVQSPDEAEPKLRPAEFKNDSIILPDGKVFDLKRTGFRVGAETATSTAGRYGITKVGANQQGVADFSLKVYQDAKTGQYGVELTYKVPGEKKWEDISGIKNIDPKELKSQLEASMTSVENLSEQLASAAEEAALPEAEIVAEESEIILPPRVDTRTAALEPEPPAVEKESIKDIADVAFDDEEKRVNFKDGSYQNMTVDGFTIKMDTKTYANGDKHASFQYFIDDNCEYSITIQKINIGDDKIKYGFIGRDPSIKTVESVISSEFTWTPSKGKLGEFIKTFSAEVKKLKDAAVAKKEVVDKAVADNLPEPEIRPLTPEQAKEKRKQVEKYIKSIGAKKHIFVYTDSFDGGEKLGLEDLKLRIGKLWEILKKSNFKGEVGLGIVDYNTAIFKARIRLNIEESDWESKIEEMMKIWNSREKIYQECTGFFGKDIKMYNDSVFSPEKEQEILERVRILRKMKLHKVVSKDKKFGQIGIVGEQDKSFRNTDGDLQLNIEQDNWLEELSRLTGLTLEQLRTLAEKAGLKAEETPQAVAGGEGKKEGEPLTPGFSKEKYVAPDGSVVNMEIEGVKSRFYPDGKGAINGGIYSYFLAGDGDERKEVHLEIMINQDGTFNIISDSEDGKVNNKKENLAAMDLTVNLKSCVDEVKGYYKAEGLAADTADTKDKKKTSWKERWEKVKGIKEAVWQKEIGLAVGDMAYKTVSTVFGVKFLTDVGRLAHYGIDKMRKKDVSEGNYGDIASNLQGRAEIKDIKKMTLELLGLMKTETDPGKIGEAQNELAKKIEKARNIDPEGKKRLLEQLQPIFDHYQIHIKDADEKRVKRLQGCVSVYLSKKISAVSIARDALVTATTFSGMLATRGLIYAYGAMIERGKKALNEVDRNKAEGMEYGRLSGLDAVLKDLIVNATVETVRGLMFKGAKKDVEATKTRKAIDFVQSVGVIMRGFGIYGAAISEGSGAEEQVDKFLENLRENGVLRTMGENFAHNADKFLHPVDTVHNIYDKLAGNTDDLHTSHGRMDYYKKAIEYYEKAGEKGNHVDDEVNYYKGLLAQEENGIDTSSELFDDTDKGEAPTAPAVPTAAPEVGKGGGSVVEQAGGAPASEGVGTGSAEMQQKVLDDAAAEDVKMQIDALRAKGVNITPETSDKILASVIEKGKDGGLINSEGQLDVDQLHQTTQDAINSEPQVNKGINLFAFLEGHPGAKAEVDVLAAKYGLPKDPDTVQKIYDSAKVFAGKDAQTGKTIDSLIESDARRKLTIFEAILNSGDAGKANALNYLTDKDGLNLHGIALKGIGGGKGLTELVNGYKSDDPEMVQKLYLALERQSGTTIANSGVDFTHEDLYAKGKGAHFFGIDSKGKPIMEDGEAYKVTKEIKSPKDYIIPAKDVLGGRVPSGEPVRGVLTPLDQAPAGGSVSDTLGGHTAKELGTLSAWAETDPGVHALLDTKDWSDEATSEFLQTFATAHPGADLSTIGNNTELSNQFRGELATFEPKGGDWVDKAVDVEIAQAGGTGGGTKNIAENFQESDKAGAQILTEERKVVTTGKAAESVESKPAVVPAETAPEVVGPTPKAPIVVGESGRVKTGFKFLDDSTVRDVEIGNKYEPKIDPNDPTRLQLKIGDSPVSGKLTHTEVDGSIKPVWEMTNAEGGTDKFGFDKRTGGLKDLADKE